jgi:hypothetical protein
MFFYDPLSCLGERFIYILTEFNRGELSQNNSGMLSGIVSDSWNKPLSNLARRTNAEIQPNAS